jgi:hypothetical protein
VLLSVSGSDWCALSGSPRFLKTAWARHWVAKFCSKLYRPSSTRHCRPLPIFLCYLWFSLRSGYAVLRNQTKNKTKEIRTRSEPKFVVYELTTTNSFGESIIGCHPCFEVIFNASDGFKGTAAVLTPGTGSLEELTLICDGASCPFSTPIGSSHIGITSSSNSGNTGLMVELGLAVTLGLTVTPGITVTPGLTIGFGVVPTKPCLTVLGTFVAQPNSSVLIAIDLCQVSG